MRTVLLAVAALLLMAQAPVEQTLIILPRNPAVPVLANAVPKEPATGTQYAATLPADRCANLLAQLANNPLAATARCADGAVLPPQ